MSNEYGERRAYRKSPGRQYGYDYDPLRGQQYHNRSELEDVPASISSASLHLAPRPDPRRTRQLLRQNILASKAKNGASMYTDEQQVEDFVPRHGYAKTVDQPEQLGEDGEDGWRDFDFRDPRIGYEDPLDQRVGYAKYPPMRRPELGRPIVPEPEIFDEDEYAEDEEYEDERSSKRRKAKKRKVSRRRLLWGLGLGAIAAGGVAAYELAPRIPKALEGVGTNIEKDLQNAYNQGIAAGEEAVRKEFLNALDDMEGVSLQAAIASARLTRLAYDAFVAPLVTLAATIAGDFLSIILNTLITARNWLARIGQDNTTLAALQTVLETWKQKMNELPMELQSITDADLDGAQSYLRALQRKIQTEQAKLNSASTSTPTTTSTVSHTSTPSAKPSSTPSH